MRNHQTKKLAEVSGCFRVLELVSFLCILVVNGNSQAPEWPWAKGFHGTAANFGSTSAVSINGDVYTTGDFVGTTDFDPGPGIFNLYAGGFDDIFISKLDSAGNFVWAKAIGEVSYDGGDLGSSIAVDGTGNVYVISAYEVSFDADPGEGTYILPLVDQWDFFVIKLDSQGDFIWAKSINGIGIDFAVDITIDTIRDYLYITGSFDGVTDFDPGPDSFILSVEDLAPDIFILKLDLDGNFEWAGAMGGRSEDRPHSISLDSAGNVCITGGFREVADFNPGVGLFELTSNGSVDIFIVKLSGSGEFSWAKSMGSTGADYGEGIDSEIPNGNIFVTGVFSDIIDFDPGPDSFKIIPAGGGDAFITKFDPVGNFIWAKTFTGPSSEIGIAITLDQGGNGGIYVTGSFRETTDFDPGPSTYNLSSNGYDNIFICKLNRLGDFIWAYGAGGESWDYSQDVELDRFGYGFVTGFIQSTSATFGSTTIVNNSTSTSYVSKFYACNGIVSNTLDSGRGSLRDVISCSSNNKFISIAIPALSQITLTSGEIGVKHDITLSGTPSFDLSISGNNTSRIFKIYPGKNMSIKDLTLKNGNALTNGGAILTEGNLTLENILLKNNYENGVPKGLTILSPDITINILGHVDIKY